MRRPAFLTVPEFLLKLGGEMVDELILSGVRVVPRKLQESGYRFRHPELRPALQAVLAGDVGS
jgi:NAD dependent epimerase/dehydratase family enzyme